MIKEYVNLMKELSNEDLELNINKELEIPTRSTGWKLISICAIIVDRTYTHHRVFLNQFDISDAVISLYIHIRNKKKIKVSELITQARKEINLITKYFPIYSIVSNTEDGLATSYYMENIFKSSETKAEDQVLIERMVDFIYQNLPDHIKPLFMFYLDTGYVIDGLLDPLDKAILRRALDEIGGNQVDTKGLEDKIPKNPKGKGLFINNLADESPEILSLLIMLGDLNKLVTLCEMFGGQEFKFPTSEELLELLKNSASDSNKFVNGTNYSSKFVQSLISNLDLSTDEKSRKFIVFFASLLSKEQKSHSDSLDILKQKMEEFKITPTQYYRVINQELDSSISLLERIKKLTALK